MNAPFNSLEFVHNLEREGLPLGAAKAIAPGIDDGRSDLVTNDTLARKFGTLREEMLGAIALSASQQVNKLGAIVGGSAALVVAILGAIIAVK